MNDQIARQVRRVEVTDPIAASCRYDYADAFEVCLPAPDPYSPETWVRAGLGASPKWVKRTVGLLRIRRDAAGRSADGGIDWRVVESGPEVVHLEKSLALMRVVLVGRRVEPMRRTLTTILNFERPVLARLVWVVIGMGHRRMAPHVLTSKIAEPVGSVDADSERTS